MAVKVYNNATQEVIEVDPKEAQRGIQQGDYSPTGRVRVARGNRTGTVDAADVLTALGQGVEIIDETQAAQIKLTREESDIPSQIQGGAEAVASGATLGLSSVAIDALGGDPERMAARRETLGKGATGLEIAGAIAPTFFTGGANLAAQGAARATGRGLAATVLRNTPAGLAARVGARAEAGLAVRMGAGPGSRILPAGARNFIEGAAQGAGAQLDENVLGDRDLTADLLGATTMGGLFSTGAGAVIPGLARIAGGATRAPIAGMRSVLGRLNSSSGGLASREAAEIAVREGQDALSGGAQLWKKTSLLAGAPEDLADRLARKGDTDEGVEHILRVDREMPRIHREAAELVGDRVNTIHRELRDVQRYATGEAKIKNWERQIGGTPEAHRAAAFAIDDMFVKARNELDDVIRKNAEDADRFRATTHSGPMLKQADEAVGRMHLDITEAEKLAGKAKVARKAAAVDAYKRRLGSIVEENGGWGGMRMATPEVRATNMQLRKMYSEAKTLLEREDILFGAAVAQREINGAYSAMAQADDLFEEASKGTGLASVVDADGTINAAKALKLIRAHGRVGGDVTVMRLMDAMDARVTYLKKIGQHVEMDDVGRASIAKVERSVTDLRKQMHSLADDAALADDLATHRSIVGNKSPSHTLLTTQGPALMGALGLGFGGPIGMAAGIAVGAATQPHRTLLNYAALRHQLAKTDAKLGGAIKGMFSGAADVRMKLPKIDLPRAPVGVTGRAAARDSDQTERRETALARAAELNSSPDAIARALAVPHFEIMDVAPGLAGVMQSRVQKAAAFLASKAPKSYGRPYSKTKLVDPVSAASFERYLDAVKDPIGALEKFRQGRITGETAEAIRIVYPALWADIQERVQTHLADSAARGEEVDYDTRVRLGQLFKTPTDPSLRPPVANEIQMAIGANFDDPTGAEMVAGANAPKPSGKAGKVEGNPSKLQTSTERASSWRQQA